MNEISLEDGSVVHWSDTTVPPLQTDPATGGEEQQQQEEVEAKDSSRDVLATLVSPEDVTRFYDEFLGTSSDQMFVFSPEANKDKRSALHNFVKKVL